MYHIFCIHSSVEGHLGSFQLLAIINKTAMNIVEHVSSLHVGASSGYMPRSCITGSSGPIYTKNSRSWTPENQITLLKMGYRAKQRILNWRILNGWETTEKMFSILNHQGNANQNNPEIPPHTSQNGWDQRLRWQQMLARMWRKRNTLGRISILSWCVFLFIRYFLFLHFKCYPLS